MNAADLSSARLAYRVLKVNRPVITKLQNIVKWGYSLEFESQPCADCSRNPIHFNDIEQGIIDKLLKCLLWVRLSLFPSSQFLTQCLWGFLALLYSLKQILCYAEYKYSWVWVTYFINNKDFVCFRFHGYICRQLLVEKEKMQMRWLKVT